MRGRCGSFTTCDVLYYVIIGDAVHESLPIGSRYKFDMSVSFSSTRTIGPSTCQALIITEEEDQGGPALGLAGCVLATRGGVKKSSRGGLGS